MTHANDILPILKVVEDQYSENDVFSANFQNRMKLTEDNHMALQHSKQPGGNSSVASLNIYSHEVF